MDFIQTITTSFKALADNLKARVSSPFGGAFISIWLIWNWRLTYYFLNSSGATSDKISHINMFYIERTDVLVMPFLLTIGYLVAFPLLSNLSTLLYTVVDNWTKSINVKFIEKSVFLTGKDRENIYADMRIQNDQHEKDIKDYRSRIESLHKALRAKSIDENRFGEDVGDTDNADTFTNTEGMKSDDIADGKGYHTKRLEVLAGGISPQLSVELISEEMENNAFLKRMSENIDSIKKGMGGLNAEGVIKHLQLDEPVLEGQKMFAEAVLAVIKVLRSRQPRSVNLEDMTELVYGHTNTHVNEHEIKDFMGLPVALGLACIERKNEYALTIDGLNIAKAD